MIFSYKRRIKFMTYANMVTVSKTMSKIVDDMRSTKENNGMTCDRSTKGIDHFGQYIGNSGY